MCVHYKRTECWIKKEPKSVNMRKKLEGKAPKRTFGKDGFWRTYLALCGHFKERVRDGRGVAGCLGVACS